MPEKKHPMMFMVPSPLLGRTDDVYPELITAATNEWIDVSRHILKMKQEASIKGQYRANYEIGDDARDLHPFGAQYCPALQEAHSMGYLLKWPATAIVRKVTDKGWMIKPSTNFNFIKYHGMATFLEAGEAEAISIDTGWSFITPPGWSILVKGVPNLLGGNPGGMIMAEGIIRSDQAVIGLQIHGFVPDHAPKEFKITRGKPMALVFPFRREELGMAVMDDDESIAATKVLIDRITESADRSTGLYRRLYIEDFNPTPFYDQLYESWETRHAAEMAAAQEAAKDESEDDGDADDGDES